MLQAAAAASEWLPPLQKRDMLLEAAGAFRQGSLVAFPPSCCAAVHATICGVGNLAANAVHSFGCLKAHAVFCPLCSCQGADRVSAHARSAVPPGSCAAAPARRHPR